MKRALIFGGGVYGDEFPTVSENDFIVAADAGYEILEKHSLAANVIVGDFDSAKLIPENAVVLPVEKDVTDSFAAVDIAIKNGCDEICIYGGMGGRPDHTFANYALVVGVAEKGLKAVLYGEDYCVTAVKNSSITINGKKGKTVSVFSWSDKSEGVTLKGFKYPLSNAELKNGFALGVSNLCCEDSAVISVEKGILLIMIES